MTTTQTAADTYYQHLTADCSSGYWQAQYEADQIAFEYQQWETQQQANEVPVVQLNPKHNTAPATALAVPAGSPFVAELVAANNAIATTISELNMLVLNTADAATRTRVKSIATKLVSKAPLMDCTRENYLSMLDAAEANAATYYGSKAVEVKQDPKPVYSPYKRKYETAAEILQHLATTSTRKEIASLYYVNAELIQQTPSLEKAFMDRKAGFYRPSTAAA